MDKNQLQTSIHLIYIDGLGLHRLIHNDFNREENKKTVFHYLEDLEKQIANIKENYES